MTFIGGYHHTEVENEIPKNCKNPTLKVLSHMAPQYHGLRDNQTLIITQTQMIFV